MVSFPKIKSRRQQSSEGSLSGKRSGLFRTRKTASGSEDKSTLREGKEESLEYPNPSTPVTPATTGSLSPEAFPRIESSTTTTPFFDDVQVAKYRSDVSRGGDTVISELTNPKLILQHQPSDLETLDELQPLSRVRTQQSTAPAVPVYHLDETTRNAPQTTMETIENEPPIPEDDGYLARVLTMMEQSCMGTMQALTPHAASSDRKVVSFAPEWGVPPSKDDDDSTTYNKSVSETRTTYRSNNRKENGGVNGETAFVSSAPYSVPDDGTAASQASSTQRNSPSRAQVLLRKARNAREQKKKADSDKRYKDIVMSLKEDGGNNLPTVDEAKVRVPQMDGTYQFLHASDFLGKEESVDDEATAISKYSANELLGAQHMPEENSRLFSNSRGWLGMLATKANYDDMETFSTGPVDMDQNYGQTPVSNEGVKPQWKEHVDAASGRVYYYHRVTRETTWKRPPEDQLVKKNSRIVSTTEREIREIIEDKMPYTDDEIVLSKRDRIARMLTAMAPPNTIIVEELVIEFAGREDDLIKQLRSVNESKPFDEPVQRPEQDPREEVQQAVPMDGHTRSAKTVSSAYSLSTKSRLSEMTPQIRNTRNPGSFQKIYEEADSNGGPPSRVPSNIPVPRRRDLKVEEYSNDRRRAETFETRRAGPVPRRILNQQSFLKTDGTYLSDDEDVYLERDANSVDHSGIHDSVSEYSANVYDTRRKDLEDAIANQDWDLAAALSEGMRSIPAKSIPQKNAPESGEQSELDQLLSQKDWDGIANYIVQLRANGNTNGEPDAADVPSKHFGARSRLQHTNSESVEDESTNGVSDNRFRYRKNEFAC